MARAATPAPATTLEESRLAAKRSADDPTNLASTLASLANAAELLQLHHHVKPLRPVRAARDET